MLASRPPADDASAVLAHRGQRPEDDERLDPLERHRAALAPPDLLPGPPPVGIPHLAILPAAFGAPASSVRAVASLEHLIPTLVRRIAWSGDRHRGAVRVELGAGELAGGTLLVHAEAGRVRVQLDAPPGVDTMRWQQRISDRLALRGLATDAVEVT